jgi:TolB-like protein/DNA-binding winged helix-turn-helix (wHTH) protein/Tfp pilus assembly protein PilF
MQTPPANLYEFGDFQLDTAKRRLRRLDGTPVLLTPRVFDTLLYMVEHHDAVLDKERIMEAVWPDSIVEENNLAQAISKLRQVFGETPGSHSYIVTVPGRGYRFVADVNKRTEDALKNETANGRMGETARSQPTSGLAGSPHKPEAFEATAEVADSPVRRFPRAAGLLWAAAISAIAIVSLAALFFVRYRSLPASVRAPNSSLPARAVSSVTAPIPEKSVAVLPFDNLSDEKQNAYFADGVQDEVLTNLARIADLKVISRISVMQYKSGIARNLRQIARELGVTHVVEGSVQRAGNRVRVNAQLLDARTDRHVWAQIYDRDLADVFAIQSEIAKTIADQLEAKLSPSEKGAIERAPTNDITAFDLYTRAKNLLLRATTSGAGKAQILQAADLLNQAVTRDPSFFQAYCEMAQAYDTLYSFGYDHTSARLSQAEAAVQAAARLRPDAPETHLARAENLYRGYLDYDGALAQLQVARQSLPNDPQVVELKGYIERRQGHWEEAIRDLQRAIELDPRNIRTLLQTAGSYQLLRRYAEEKSVLERVLAFEPDDAVAKVQHAFTELDSKADTRPLHRTIESIRATNPTAAPSIANNWLICALAERDDAAAKNALVAFGENPITFGTGDIVVLNRPFVEGIIARMTKDDDKARAAFITARAEQEKIVQAQPNYGPPLVLLGLIDAALGRKEEALREGRRAVGLLPVEKDSINGPLMIEYLAMIAAWVGDKDLACEQLAAAVRYPSTLSYGKLKLLPFWDPLRGDPRFEQIVASLAPKEN